MLSKSVIPGLCLILLISPALRADELDELRVRNAQLEATVEELTLQLAEALRDRRRLEAELASVRAASPVAAASAAVQAPAATGAPATPAAPAPSPVEAAADPVMEQQLREVPITNTAAPEPEPEPEPEPVARAEIDGCDVIEALTGYDGKRAGNERLRDWLLAADNLERCTTEQLRELRGAIKWDWLGYQKEPIRLIDAELARR